MIIKELYQLYLQHQPLTTDSRQCPAGSIFLALKGERFDGNQYAVGALQQGCAYAVISDAQVMADAPEALRQRLILVDDTLLTLKHLAREHRRQFNIPVLAITGTNGKTTTKELIAAVLRQKYRVLATEGNLNNDIGVPKTLLRLTPEHEIAIIEMGASHPGDIKTLVETAEPTCGLITNCGRAHLQGFGSYEGVCRTKGELYDWLAAGSSVASAAGSACDGIAATPALFINGDDSTLLSMADQRHIVSRQLYHNADGTTSNPFLSVPFGDGRIDTQLIGRYNEPNVQAAICVGRTFGVSDADIAKALTEYQPTNNRSQLVRTQRNTLIVDAYNANPSSMALAIDNFRQMETTMPKMAILGQMNELGAESRAEHQRIVEQLKQSGITHIILIGQEFDLPSQPFTVCHTTDEAKQMLSREQPEGRLILIKGSNSFRLFELPPLL